MLLADAFNAGGRRSMLKKKKKRIFRGSFFLIFVRRFRTTSVPENEPVNETNLQRQLLQKYWTSNVVRSFPCVAAAVRGLPSEATIPQQHTAHRSAVFRSNSYAPPSTTALVVVGGGDGDGGGGAFFVSCCTVSPTINAQTIVPFGNLTANSNNAQHDINSRNTKCTLRVTRSRCSGGGTQTFVGVARVQSPSTPRSAKLPSGVRSPLARIPKRGPPTLDRVRGVRPARRPGRRPQSLRRGGLRAGAGRRRGPGGGARPAEVRGGRGDRSGAGGVVREFGGAAGGLVGPVWVRGRGY